MENREGGICKKADTYHQFYQGDIIVVIRQSNGSLCGYQSREGLTKELCNVPSASLRSPGDYLSENQSKRLQSRSTSPESETSSMLSDMASTSLEENREAHSENMVAAEPFRSDLMLPQPVISTRATVSKRTPVFDKTAIKSLLSTCFE